MLAINSLAGGAPYGALGRMVTDNSGHEDETIMTVERYRRLRTPYVG